MADGGDVAGLAQTARRGAVLLCLTLALMLAASHPGAAKTLADFLAEIAPADVIPGGASFGAAEGEPPLVPVLDAGGERLGWAYLNTDFTTSVGYSGKPIRIVVGIDKDGKVRGLKLVEHHEPIVLIGIPEAKVMAALNGLIDQDLGAVAAGTAKPPQVDIVSGATVTVLVMGDSVVRSAVKLIRSGRLSGATSAGAAPAAAKRALDPAKTEVRDWQSLIGDGSVRSLQLTVGEVSQAFQDAGQPAAAGHPESANPEDRFIEFYVAPVSVPAIGRSLLGDTAYDRLAAKLAPGQAALLIAGDGAYSFKGSAYVRGGIFDRVELIQDGQGIALPRPQPHAAERHRRRRRAEAARGRALRRAGRLRVRRDRALRRAAPRPARHRGTRQGRPSPSTSATTYPRRTSCPRLPPRRRPSRPRRRPPASPTRTQARRSGSASGR